MMTISEKHKGITLTEEGNSPLEQAIRRLPVDVCNEFVKDGKLIPAIFTEKEETLTTKDSDEVAKSFPNTVKAHENKILVGKNNEKGEVPTGKRIAVLFSGGPAAGGHNVIVGLKKIIGEENTLFGVKTGPKGLLAGDLIEITEEHIKLINNTGGFDFIGSDRTKIKTDDQFNMVKKVCQKNKLDAIVVIGGDDSNTNAGVLAEMLFENVHEDGSGVQVIGVPKTIDGDLQVGKMLPISFGFHTATSIYSELTGNILKDTPSSKKYWHFVKLMGRSASHVTLEVALQTKPAITLISEEVAEKKISLNQLVDQIAKTVIARSKNGLNHGVVLIPEGVIEFIPEMINLIAELNDTVSEAMEDENYRSLVENKDTTGKCNYIYDKLSSEQEKLMKSFPDYIQEMLLAERDSHGNLQVSLIPTEKLLIDMTTARIKELDSSVKFNTQNHFFGYEGRCGVPTKFDMSYCLNLGMTAGSLVLAGKTGYIASVTGIDIDGTPLALPLTGLFNIERRHGQDEMVIEKALVELDSEAFKYFVSRREAWSKSDLFASPGPRQLWGPVSDRIPKTVFLNKCDHHSTTYELGDEVDLFPDDLMEKAKAFFEKHSITMSVDKDAIRKVDEKTGLEYYKIVLPKDITEGDTHYKKDSHIAINMHGKVYAIRSEYIK